MLTHLRRHCNAARRLSLAAPVILHGFAEMVQELHFVYRCFNSLAAGIRAFHCIAKTAAVVENLSNKARL